MNLDEIEKKCFILALFIRDDGERFLLGSRMFEFLDSQLHFSGNNYQNDIVEVQGNDGVMLAGQVRRGSSQAFDGYIGDSSVDRSTIEQYRRSFFQFFRKNHYYKVVYIFTDGTAIQRRQGFIVEAPEVKELYQLFPQYHISMNFEDINYYNYEEDSEGQEIYGESATLKVITSATGGLIWEDGSQTTISGEGSSFTLQDTIEDNVLESVSIKGDTTQQTYSGKNLLKFNNYSANYSSTSFTDFGNIIEIRSRYGVAAKLDISANYFKITALSTSDLSQTWNFKNLEANTTYTISCDAKSVGDQDNPYIFEKYHTLPSRISATFTTNASGEKSFGLMFYQINTNNAYVELSNIQVEKTSQPTAYEPYVGGIPAPNPDYPQPVQVVTGDQIIDIYNKNLWGMSSITATSGSVTISGPDSIGEYSLTWEGAFTAELSPVMNLNSSSYYAISFKHKGAALSLQRVGGAVMATTDDDSDYTTYSFVLSGETELNFELIRRGLTTGVTAYVKEFQVEIGSTATPYQTHQSYEVNLGKNLFDNSTATLKNRIGPDGSLIADDPYCTSDYINVSPSETYTYSRNASGAGYGAAAIAYYDSSKTFISRTMPIIPTSSTSGALVTPSNARYARICDFTSIIDNMQFELGSTATTYAPYFTPIELCKIGTYQDYIYKSGDDWYVHKAIGKYIFTGSESWGSAGEAGSGYYGYWWGLSGNGIDILRSDPNYYMTHLKWRTYGSGIQENCYMIVGPTGGVSLVVISNNSNFANVNSYKTWLSNNSVTFYYPLATTTDTQITNADLITQLEALLGATTYDGQTIFTVSSQNQLAILNVSVIAITNGGVVWDNYGAEWEEGTGGGPTMIDIESIDNVYPVWELTGPAVNPQISVLNTNTTLSYTGTVTASQTLKIDMFNKTATLNGASVIGNVSGDWVYLEPGINRLTYTTSNADAPDSTIWWQEIVG